MNDGSKKPVDRFRTKCFLREEDRIAAHKERIRISMNKPKRVIKKSPKKGG